MANKKNLIQKYLDQLKTVDFQSFFETLKNVQIEDLKNIDYKRLFSDIKRSRYTKPIGGLFSASLLFTLVFIPNIETIQASFKKVRQYRYEASSLDSQKLKLQKEVINLEKTSKIMTQVNDSFLKKNQIIFISKLINEVAKKSNIKINSFAPIIKPDKSKLCKNTIKKPKSQNFNSVKKKNKSLKKGAVKDNYYELNFTSDYLNILEFLRIIQSYEVMVISHCLEVNSENTKIFNNQANSEDRDSLIIPLASDGSPLSSISSIKLSNEDKNSGKVLTRIVLKIPSYFK